MKNTTLQNIGAPGPTPTPKNFRSLRRLCGLAIAAIGLSAPIASAVSVPVINGNFETEFGTNTDPTLNWAKLTSWTFNNTNTAILPIGTAFTTDASGAGSGNYTRFTYNTAGIEQNLNTTVSSGDTISVSFSVGSNATTEANFTVNPARVRGWAYFLVGSTRYDMPFNLAATPTNGVWVPMTFTTTVSNTGNLTLGFQNYRNTDPGSNNSYYTSLDGVSDVTLTPAANDPNAPTSTGATLAALEYTATPLAAGDFGYADPNSSPLAAVQITAVPTLGTLTYNGNPVANNDVIAAADIGNLSYLSPLGGFGSPYTTIGIKVQNSALLWSLPAVMTVNVTDVNHAPTSSGGSVVMGKNTVKTFAAADFQFSDIDAGDTLQAIKVTSLPNPTNGTLTLSASAVTLNQVVDVADITAGNLIYTPSTDYTGSDPFNFQVRDAALFSADATMALTVTSDIIVQNGSFETRALPNWATYWWALGSPWVGGISPQGYEVLQVNQFNTFTAAADGLYAANLESWLVSVTQNLNTTVNAGDTLSMTFSGGRAKGQAGGKFTATFVVGTTEYTSSEFDTALLANDTWQSYTFTTPIANTGNLSIVFRPVSGRPWLDKISNVSVTTGGGSPYTTWAGSNAFDSLNSEGVAYGMAWILGATSPSSPSIGLMPQVTGTSGSGLTVHFTRVLDPGTAKLYLEYSDSLDVGSWGTPVEVPTATGTVSGVGFTVGTAGGLYDITAEIPLGTSGKRFARLVTTE